MTSLATRCATTRVWTDAERAAHAAAQRADEEARIAAAPPLTCGERAELARAIERGWSEHGWLLVRLIDREARAEAAARVAKRERDRLAAESPEAEEARWRCRFAQASSHWTATEHWDHT